MYRFVAFGLAAIAVPGLAYSGEAIELTFVDHVTAEMVEQDVYISKEEAGKVFRVTAPEAPDHATAQVYRTAVPVEHSPMDADNTGPFEGGEALGFTLGEWLSGTGSGTYTCSGDTATLKVTFENLVPDGLYTMWNFFAANNLARFKTYDLPMGAPDGSESGFRADGKGNAIYEATTTPCLQGSTPQLLAGLAIAYHSDDATHGDEPGPMGSQSHVQLFTALPADADMPK